MVDVDLDKMDRLATVGELCGCGAVVPTKELRALSTELRERRAADAWKPLLGEDGTVAVAEGRSYLFAIQVSTNGAPPCWEYWQDAVVWDAETEPDFAGDPGWSISDEIYFRALPSSPEERVT